MIPCIREAFLRMIERKRWQLSGSSIAPVSSVSTKAMIAVSGVRSSCETFERNSCLTSSRRSIRVMSKKTPSAAFRSISIGVADRHDTQIEYLAFWSMSFDFDAAAFDAFEAIEKRAVDRGIACELGQALGFQRGHRRIEEFMCGGVRGHDAHVFVHDKETFAHTAHRRFKQRTDGDTLQVIESDRVAQQMRL